MLHEILVNNDNWISQSQTFVFVKTMNHDYVQQKLSSLDEKGFVDVSELYPTCSVIQQTLKIVTTMIDKKLIRPSRGYTGRKFYHVKNETITDLLTALFSREFIDILTKYMGGPVSYQSCSVVYVPGNSRTQMVHKDHMRGDRLVTCLALSLDPKVPIQTHFRPGTHKSKIIEDGTLQNMQQLKSPMLLYDTSIQHCGSTNLSTKPDMNRLFFSFLSSIPSPQIQGRLKRENVMFQDKAMQLY